MEQLVNFIIRPPRAVYKPENDLPTEEFTLRRRFFRRKDIQVKNNRGNVLQCSHYLPRSVPEGLMLPCVIYCHGNSGCRLDATEAAEILLPSNITVFALDFSGSGLSEGEYVTLGWNEKEDLRAVVNYLRTEGNVSLIGLWGRSMGAVTSLMYGAEDPSIAGMVLDSPFSNLVDLMMELVDSYRYPLPKFTVKFAIQHMRKIIKKKADFDIMSLDAVEVAKCCFVPALLGHATDDDFIRPHHSDVIFGAYEGDKNIIKFDGDHNSPRPQFYFDSITIFFHNVLNPPKDGFDEGLLAQENWDEVIALHHQGPAQLLSDSDIDLVRIRRPMSRMEFPHDAPLIELSEVKEDTREGATAPSSSSSLVPDGGFLSCPLEDWSEVPYTLEEEERMLNEAMSLSLRDWQVQHSKEQNQTDTPDVTNENLPHVNAHLKNHIPNPSESTKEDSVASKAPAEHGNCSSSDFTDDLSCQAHASISTKENLPAVNPLKTQDHCYGTLEDSIASKTRASSVTNENLPPGKNQHTEASIASRAHVGRGNDTDDISDKTHASIVVQRTASGNPLEGLIQRWGSFFKNK